MTTAREDATRLADLLGREHHALADFLIALAAFDRERRWEELDHASLFSFLTRELRLSAGAAQYRKTAVGLVQQYPAVEAALRSGDLCLSSVIELAKVITPENAAEILPRFFGLSSRDAAFVAASIRPVAVPRRDFIVTPVRDPVATELSQPAVSLGSANDLQLRAPETELTSVTTATAAVTAPPVPPPFRERPKVKPLDAERARVNMTVSRRLLDKLAAARDVLSHSHPGASEEQILEVGLDLILQRYAKRRGLRAKPRNPAAAPKANVSASAPAVPQPKRSRHIPAAIWRAVWERDHGCCSWPLEGGACAARRTGSSSTTSRASRGELRPRSKGEGCSAALTSSLPPASFTGTRSWTVTSAETAGAARSRWPHTAHDRSMGPWNVQGHVAPEARVPAGPANPAPPSERGV